MNTIVRTATLFLACLSAGCASMNADECLTADWELVGYNDGSKGQATTRLESHRKACAKHGVSPDLGAYTAGHDRGVRQYCVPETAFNVGKSGRNMPNICPVDLNNAFVAAFKEGRQLYSAIRNANTRIAAIDEEIEEMQQEIDFLEKATREPDANGKLPSSEETAAARRLIERLENSIASKELDRGVEVMELDTLRAQTLDASSGSTAARQ